MGQIVDQRGFGRDPRALHAAADAVDQDVAGIGRHRLLQVRLEAVADADARMVNYYYADRQQGVAVRVEAAGLDVDHAPALLEQRTFEVAAVTRQGIEPRPQGGVERRTRPGERPDHRS